MKFNLLLLILSVLLLIDVTWADTADTGLKLHDSFKRELRRGGSKSRSRKKSRSSYYKPAYRKPRPVYRKPARASSYRKTYKKTTYRKTYTKKTYRRYTGSFRGGRSYGVLYAYYLPPNYYNAIGYYSPLYRIKYYNGYGYNFYYRKYNYYADSPNAVMRSDTVSIQGPSLGGLFGICICTCFIAIWCYCMCTGRCRGDEEHHSEHESVHEEECVEEVVEEECVEEVYEESFG